MGFVSPMPIREEQKANARKLSLVFCQLTAVEKKKDNHMVDIN
jgi:hypothetical protein